MRILEVQARHQNDDKNYKGADMKDYDISIGFILVNSKNKFLVMRKTVDGVWDFPKGHVKPNDDNEIATAIRELAEETGISANGLKLIEGFRNVNTYINPEKIHRKIILFLAICDAEPVLSPEHTTYQWADLEKAKKLLRFKGGQDAVTKAYRFLQKQSKDN